MWRQLCGGRDLCRKSAASAWRSAAHAAQHGRRASPWRPLAMLERRASRGWAVEPCSEGQRTKNHFGKKMMAREWLFATCAHRRGRWSTDIIRFYIGAFEHGSSRASGPTSEAARGRMAGRAGAPQREPLVDEIGRLRRGVLAIVEKKRRVISAPMTDYRSNMAGGLLALCAPLAECVRHSRVVASYTPYRKTVGIFLKSKHPGCWHVAGPYRRNKKRGATI